jgi:ParB family transcriptional regulator, chromosome partitioning protein
LGNLRGRQLIRARRVIERRMNLGRSARRGTPRKRTEVTSLSLVRTYQKEVERQRLLVRKAEFTQQRLLFITSALRELFADENFTNLMRAEGLDSLPKYLSERIHGEGAVA